MNHSIQHIHQTLMNAPIDGVHLQYSTLGEELSQGPSLLIFLRHFGCMFCRETVKDIRAIVEREAAYPLVLFFYQGTVAQGEAFFKRYYPSARAVADPTKYFYTHFGLERGSIGQMFGPEVWACGVQSLMKGNFIGLPVGDPWTMPGAFLVQDESIIWQHTYRHVGDHPAFDALALYMQNHTRASQNPKVGSPT
jgi:hypothetical protein